LKISKDLKYALFSRDREIDEQSQIALTAIPFLGVTALILIIFMVITLIDFPFENSQHIEAIFAVLSPAMALITSFGILWGIGLPFSNILTVVPFLVITIGVDDAFLILAAWRHSSPDSTLETRMGETLIHSGASVTVTSLTDILCFVVGLFSNLPVVQLFCIYTSVAIMIDFIYQITFFTAIVAYKGRQKINYMKRTNYCGQNFKSRNIIDGLWSKSKQKNSHKLYVTDADILKYYLPNGDSLSPKMLKKISTKSQNFLQKFINILHLPFTKFVVIAAFITHITVISYLCTEVNTDFNMENLYLENSNMNAISRQLQRFNLKEAFVVNFGLYPLPNFADVFIRNKFDRLVEELETIPEFGMGSNGTVLWTRDFADIIALSDDESNFWQEDNLLSIFREYEIDEKFITTELVYYYTKISVS
uniref:SSD domain-containing protein n=1 Tax=Onchocerca flexuosa TaxID=387005 RepID=A0A183H9F2_9BILA